VKINSSEEGGLNETEPHPKPKQIIKYQIGYKQIAKEEGPATKGRKKKSARNTD